MTEDQLMSKNNGRPLRKEIFLPTTINSTDTQIKQSLVGEMRK